MATTKTPAELVPLSTLKPFPGNPKRGDVGKIQESIRRNGVYRPLYVQTSSRRVMAGNHTLLALKAEGHREGWVWWHDCDDETAKRINLADNRTPELGGYDNDALVTMLGSLPDLEGTGYSSDDLTKLLGEGPDAGDTGAGPDDAYEAQHGVIVMCADSGHQRQIYEKLVRLKDEEAAFAEVELRVVAV